MTRSGTEIQSRNSISIYTAGRNRMIKSGRSHKTRMRAYTSFRFLSRLFGKLFAGHKLPAFILLGITTPLLANDWPISRTPDTKTQAYHDSLIATIPDWINRESTDPLKPVPKPNPLLAPAIETPYRLSFFDTLSGKVIPLWGSFSEGTIFGQQKHPKGIYFSPAMLKSLTSSSAALNHNWFYAITDRAGHPLSFLGDAETPPEKLPFVKTRNSAIKTLDLTQAIPLQDEEFLGVMSFTHSNPIITVINKVQKNGTATIPLSIATQLKALPDDQKNRLTLVTASYRGAQTLVHNLSLPIAALSLGKGYTNKKNEIVVTTGSSPRQLAFEKQAAYHPATDTLSKSYRKHPYDLNRVEIAVRLAPGNGPARHYRLKGLPPPKEWLAGAKLLPRLEVPIETSELATLCTTPDFCDATLVAIEYWTPYPKDKSSLQVQIVHNLSPLPLKTLLRNNITQSPGPFLSSPAIAKTLLENREVIANAPPIRLKLPHPNQKSSNLSPYDTPLLDPTHAIEKRVEETRKIPKVIREGVYQRPRSMAISDLPETVHKPHVQSDEDIYNQQTYEALQFDLNQRELDKTLQKISTALKIPENEMLTTFKSHGINLKSSGLKPDPSGSLDSPGDPYKKVSLPGKPDNNNQPVTPPSKPSSGSKRTLSFPAAPLSPEVLEQIEISKKMKKVLQERGVLPRGKPGGPGDPGGDPSSGPSGTDDRDPEDLARHMDIHPAEQALDLVQSRLTRYPLYTLASLIAATTALEIYHSWNLYPDAKEVLIRKTLKAMGPEASAFQHEALRMLVEGTPEDLLEHWGSDTLGWWVTQSCQQWCSRNSCTANVVPDIFLHYILSPVSTKKDRFLKELRVRTSLEPLDTNNPWLRTVDRRRNGYAAALDFNPVTQQYWMAKLNDHGLLQETSNLMYTTQIPVKVMRYSFLESFQVKSQHDRYKKLIPHPVTDATNQYRPVVPYPMERQRYGVYTCATVDGDKWRAIDVNGEEPGFYGVPAIIGYAHTAVDGYCSTSTMDKWLSVLGSDGQTTLLNPEYEPEQAVRLDLQNTFRKDKEELNSQTCKIQYWKERRWKTAEVNDIQPGSVEAQLPGNAFYRVRCGKETATFTRDDNSGMLYVWSWPPVSPADKAKKAKRAQPAG